LTQSQRPARCRGTAASPRLQTCVSDATTPVCYITLIKELNEKAIKEFKPLPNNVKYLFLGQTFNSDVRMPAMQGTVSK